MDGHDVPYRLDQTQHADELVVRDEVFEGVYEHELPPAPLQEVPYREREALKVLGADGLLAHGVGEPVDGCVPEVQGLPEILGIGPRDDHAPHALGRGRQEKGVRQLRTLLLDEVCHGRFQGRR